ncbi:hypothetical protein [Siphonobacter curvatus]|uniref:Uncharacterized protein n=1 Tax=Siphonobacter curvatus TaxID=2094562 RepID=A0A2S7IN60_9BACT|nr:hypothetical protein [Siphonobacter curvatus]PQA59171.1 hypothetical protein C5O19_05810 [Siphonobacter curvatus]
MSTKTNKGSFLAKVLPSLFGYLNEKDVDQAKLADIEKEAQAAFTAGKSTDLEDPEGLEEPDTEAAEDDELTKLKAEVASLKKTNASLTTENTKFKKAHQNQAAAGKVLPNEDAGTRGQAEEPQFAANDPMGIALSHWSQNKKA